LANTPSLEPENANAGSGEVDPSLARETFAWHKTTLTRFQTDSSYTTFMPTAAPPSRDVALETRVFWERFQKPILAALILFLLAIVAFTAYRFFSDRRANAASAALASAKTAQEYQQVITNYGNTPAAADAYILLAEVQRREKNFAEANKTLQSFVAKYPQHQFVSTAKMAMAANLESMGKADEALAMYQQIASAYPNSYTAPLAMLSQVYILKTKNRNEDARRMCETILTQYRTSFWANEAMQQLRLLKPITSSTPVPTTVPTIPPMLSLPAVPAPQAPPAPQNAASPNKP
jgi:tetratricopeptide (TPR) repeat protein